MSCYIPRSWTCLALRASVLPALVAVPVLAPVLQRPAAPLRAVLAFALAAITVAVGPFLGGHTVSLAITLLLFVAAVAAAAPAVVETINANDPHAHGAVALKDARCSSAPAWARSSAAR